MKINGRKIILTRTIWSLFALLIVILGSACTVSNPSLPVTGKQPSEQAGQPVTTPVVGRKSKAVQTGEALMLVNKPGGDTFQIVRVSLVSGKTVEGVKPIEIGSEVNYTFSPDRSRLAIAAKGAGCPEVCLRILKMGSLDQVAKIDLHLKNLNGNFVQQLVFDPQGKRIAIALIEQGKTRVAVVDFSQPSPQLHEMEEIPVYPRTMAFTGDGMQIMLVGSVAPGDGVTPPGNNLRIQVLLLDVQRLRVEWRQELPDIKDGFFNSSDKTQPENNYYYQVGFALDSANRRIYIAHADAERLTTVDFDRQTTATVAIRPKQTAIERMIEFILSIGVRPVQAKAANMYMRSVLLSPDGQTLYVGGEQMNRVKDGNDWKMNRVFYGLDGWDIKGGTKLFHVDTNSYDILWGAEGKILLTGYDPNASSYHPFTEIFDPSLGRITANLNDFKAFNTLSTNGETAVVSSYIDDRGRTILGILDEQNANSVLAWRQDSGNPMWLELR